MSRKAGKRPLVILLGAGATRSAFETQTPPPPLDVDFFEIAGQLSGRGTKRLASKVLKDVFELNGRVSGVGLELYFRDIETRAEIGQFAKSKNKPKDWQRRQKDLEELIRRVMLHTTCDFEVSPARVRKSEVHEKIFGQLKPGDSIVTFNYDTLIEESLPDDVAWDPRDGYGADAGGSTHEWPKNWRSHRNRSNTRTSEIVLLKLHGSLNWTLYKTNKIRLKPRPYIVRARNGAAVADLCSLLPPGWHKRINVNPYRQLWRQARLRLEGCSHLAIAGYSLPETDLLARALFAEVSRLRAARRQFLDHLYVADPNPAVRERLVTLFVPALGPTGRVHRFGDLQQLSKSWGEGHLKR